MTNDMYLGMIKRVLKTAGVDRGAILLQKLHDKQAEVANSSQDSDAEPVVERKIDQQIINESINSVRETLTELEN